MQKYFIALLILAFSLTTACSPDDDIPGNNGGTITAKIDGQSVSYNVIAVVFADGTLNVGSIGVDEGQVQFNNVDSEGTFTLNKGQGQIDVIFLTDKDGNQLAAAEGTYTIDKLTNNRAEGTFTCTSYDVTDWTQSNPIMVTDGTFEANF